MFEITINFEPVSLKRHRHRLRGGTYDPSKKDKDDFVKTIGDFSIDDLIGDPSDYYEDGYTSLDRFRNYYFSRYNVDFHEYIQLVRYIDKSLFETLKSWISFSLNCKTSFK